GILEDGQGIVGQSVRNRRLVTQESGGLYRFAEEIDDAVHQVATLGEEHATAEARQLAAFLRPYGFVDPQARTVDRSEPSLPGGGDGGLHARVVAPLVAELNRALALRGFGEHRAEGCEVGAGRFIQVHEFARAHTAPRVSEIASGQ